MSANDGFRVMVAVDGSECSQRAVDLAASLPWGEGTRITAVGVLHQPMAFVGAPWVPPTGPEIGDLYQSLRGALEDAVQEAARRVSRSGVTADREIVQGRPASALLDRAATLRPDLIVMGSRGHGGLATALLGSVSAEVADHAPCPVLVARRGHLRKVVLGVDGSTESALAEEIVATWPIFGPAKIQVVSCVDLPEPWRTGIAPTMVAEALDAYADALAELRRQHARVAEDAVLHLTSAGREATSAVCEGHAAARLIEEAEQLDADMIVVGTRGRSAAARILIGSVARAVLLHAHCSALIARPKPARA